MNRKLKGRIIEMYGSQFEFAMALKIHEASVSRIVRYRRYLTEDEQIRWARALKSDPQTLFGG